jgi:hypothetical protein
MPVRPPQGQSCATCAFYMGGLCRKGPPYLVLAQLTALAYPATMWPACQPTDWCGGWTVSPP